MASLKCKMCAGNIIPIDGKNLGVCDSCGSTVTLPSITDERRADAFNRGNHFRKIYEFDQAIAEYEQIVKEDPTDAEAHWCMMLCRYGINYQEDHRTHQRIPTCDRLSYTSVLEDPDYLAALKYADADQKALYQQEAKRIYDIQQGILQVSAKEKPFDVFICFKDTDDVTKKRTMDSVLAQDLYNELTKRNFKVFFSRITLKEEHMGQEWEPYIFAALNSAKVMLVVGTTPENFSSPWVKNEWSRFLNLRRTDKTKILLPCVKNMDPGQLPPGLRELEGRDMDEISFMQDVLYGIERVVRPQKKTENSGNSVTSDNLVTRAFMALEDEDFDKADEMLEQALNLEPENGQAHLGKLLVDLGCTSVQELAEGEDLPSESVHYNRALKFCDLATQQQLRAAETQVEQYLADKELLDQLQAVVKRMNQAETARRMEPIIQELEEFGDFRDAPQYVEQAKQRREELLKQEAEAAEKRKKELEEKAAAKKAAEEAAEAEKKAQAKRAKRYRWKQRIKKLVILLIILGVAFFFFNKKFMQEAKNIYSEAEFHMEAGNYGEAAEFYFAAANYPASRFYLPDAEEKGIEACTLWLGAEPVIATKEEYPWYSVEDGGLIVDWEKYEGDYNFTLPTILDGKLITGIGYRGFEGAYGLSYISLPANYTEIGTYGFRNCQNLTAVELNPNTSHIGESAFAECISLTNVVIPGQGTMIDTNAFSGCTYINSVTLSEGVREIGEGAFRDCDGLTAITIPGSVQYIGAEAFYGSNLASLTLSEGIERIEERAFADCDSLTAVTIPGSVTEIGLGAFEDCDVLGQVVFSNGVEVVGEGAFSGCPQIWSLTFGDTLTTIGPRAFYGDSSIGSIALPGSLTLLGEEAFAECDGIKEVWLLDNGGLTVEYGAFYGCGSLTTAYVGEGTTELGQSVFDYCENLTWVTLPEGLQTIGDWCFSHAALEKVKIPTTVTTLGEGAFYDNDSLVGLEIPAGITIIEASTFSGCDALYWVWFHEGLSIVRDDAFWDSYLKQVYFAGSADAWNGVSKGNNDILTTAELYTDFYGYD